MARVRSTPSASASIPNTACPLDAEHVLGAFSMIFWALIIVGAVKYVLLIMRADNRGEAVFWLTPLLDIFQTSRGLEGYCDEEAIPHCPRAKADTQSHPSSLIEGSSDDGPGD